ncbi:AMP-dependent synthetase/ligase [Rhizorhabdus dicambivorans]|uniref:Long-chain fatty acid--CoA ligase n=1 Tax=Rhizorhabdus dicambivorans TaxID=1850238 RepID=A0A2A4FUT8_9SPHN|nr:AMP-dependent synthetase/ligase [Rhizorhabdus dicambivorans]ATE63480.1 long-chain fatty acid--CoA ligase [Rhizorhabdus dicambivorans]PCE41464.1 long-chain fatty acid--CoA ligase [Rhizorhabdus dicambivorans]
MRSLERFPNLVTMFFVRAAEKGDAPFLWAKQDGAWTPTSWAEVARRVASLATALKAQGLKPGDRVVLVSENRPEFCIADLAIMAAGCITVPTYTTNTERDHTHILENSGARAAIVSTAKLAQTLLPAIVRSSTCEFLIGMEPLPSTSVRTLDFAELAGDADANVMATAAGVAGIQRDDLACLIYTSGTGGAPRGVRQHHGAILCNVEGCVDILTTDFGWDEEIFLSFLPLSHAYEHSGGQFLPIALGGQIYYAEGLEKLAANIEEVGPTIMVVVPRLFELIRGRLIKAVEKQGGIGKKLFDKALELATRDRLRLTDYPYKIAIDLLLKPKVAKRFGGRSKALVSGGAPLNPEIGQFFSALGLTLLQGYGQTEAGPVISCNRPRAGIRSDTVGPPMKGVEVKIAEDGEILVRGELVMHGYWRNEAETERVLRDGWLHTGDVGHLDEAGRLKITDRKKDLIVNDKGDNVAPQKVEGMLTLQPEIAQAMISGDKRPYIVGLVVPDQEWLAGWAAEQGKAPVLAALKDDPELHRALMAAVDRVNAELSVIEKVRRIAIADEPFSIENEQMTPSLKNRRHAIRAVYGERMDALYRG